MSPELLQADALDDHGMPLWLAGQAGPGSARLVVELTEGLAVTAYRELRQAVERLRRAGVALALDDLGEGFSSLQQPCSQSMRIRRVISWATSAVTISSW